MGGQKSATAVVLCVLVSGLVTSGAAAEEVRQPFRVVWNVPDAVCRGQNQDFELDRFHLEHNEKRFAGNTIALFYSAGAGKWPFIDFQDGNKSQHGGLPMNVDWPGHLRALKQAVSKVLSTNASGFSVIDMENWRPVLHTNYGRYTPYKSIFANMIDKKYPKLDQKEKEELAKKKWLNAAMTLMVKSIRVARKLRPEEHWGYYDFPQVVTRNQNGQLRELWQAINGYYPSIYIKTFGRSKGNTRNRIRDNIAESFRVRAEYGNPSDPIMPYTLAQYGPLGLFTGEWLKMSVRMPIEMGVDGLVLWASSGEFKPARPKCVAENRFIHSTLGPLIDSELERMTKCSEQLCTARGRCVKKEYADTYPYLKTRGVPELVLGTAQPSGVHAVDLSKVDQEFRSGYVCQCYDGSTGDRCTDMYEL